MSVPPDPARQALDRCDRVFAAMADFAERFLDDDPEGRIGVLSRRVVKHSIEARELIADAVLAAVPPSPPLIEALEAECEAAAERWRATAAEQRAAGHKSSMCSEENVPSHVISMARAISWEGAAEKIRTALAAARGETREEPSE